jgi:general secretion pathway protein M
MTPHALPGTAKGSVAVAAFVALAVILASITLSALGGLVAQRGALADASDILERLQERRNAPAAVGEAPARPPGSPFLEGPTLTTAGAALMQRVAGAVEAADGRITSSGVDLGGTEAPDGRVSVMANVELPRDRLQALLYDLEAGMPFLFVDRLDVQGAATSDTPDASLRVQLTVQGQWEDAR